MAVTLNKPCTCPEVAISHNHKDSGLLISASLPGVAKNDIELTIGADNFCITGEREDLKFDGCYQLVHDVDSDASTAKFENGLLTVEIPFKEPLRGKKVMIS